MTRWVCTCTCTCACLRVCDLAGFEARGEGSCAAAIWVQEGAAAQGIDRAGAPVLGSPAGRGCVRACACVCVRVVEGRKEGRPASQPASERAKSQQQSSPGLGTGRAAAAVRGDREPVSSADKSEPGHSGGTKKVSDANEPVVARNPVLCQTEITMRRR